MEIDVIIQEKYVKLENFSHIQLLKNVIMKRLLKDGEEKYAAQVQKYVLVQNVKH